MMKPSALSLAARELRAMLGPTLDLTINQIAIGHPSAAAKEQDANGSATDLLNLFFFRVERDGPADGASEDPFHVRVFCLLTAFSVADAQGNGGTVSAGEKDLRLIGRAMQALHETPLVDVRDEEGDVVARLQVVQSPLTLDDINHLWATQGELPYRLSVAYELALLPIPLAAPIERRKRVGALGLGVGVRSEVVTPAHLPFRVVAVRVPSDDPGWVPAIRLVADDGALLHALAFPVGSVPATVRVVGAGVRGAAVALSWDRWDAETGWAPVDVAATMLPLRTDTLDPDGPVPESTLVPVPDARKGQLQLTAVRTWVRPDGATVVLRSDPLLVSIHEEVAP